MTGHANHLPTSLPGIPTLNDWKKMSFVGSLFSALRRNDPCLHVIDALVDNYHKACGRNCSAGERQYLLGRMFFATLFWNNHYRNDRRMEAGRRPAIMSLNLTAAKELAIAYHCAPGAIASKLTQLFGKEMSKHGEVVDAGKTEFYLSLATRESHRIHFSGGLLHRLETKLTDVRSSLRVFDSMDYFSRNQKVYDALVKSDNRLDGENNRAGDKAGECGYALSTTDALYIAPLIDFGMSSVAKRDNLPVYHSNFMAGQPVQCAGMISVRQGRVRFLSNASGHYMPVDAALAKVLFLLQIAGTPIRQIQVQGYQAATTDGASFLRVNGRWDALKRAQAVNA